MNCEKCSRFCLRFLKFVHVAHVFAHAKNWERLEFVCYLAAELRKEESV